MFIENDLNHMLFLSTIGIYFHAITIAIVIGFSVTLTIIEFLGIKKRDKEYIKLAKQLSLIIVIAFAFGAATGTLVEFGLIQVWNGVIFAIGSFFFIPLFLELIAFTIEAALLIALVYTWDKFKNPYTHWMITLTYTFGALLSGALITSVNSWMQVPYGVGELVRMIYPWAPIYGPLLVNQDFLITLKQSLIEVSLQKGFGSTLISPTILEKLTNSYGYLLKDPWVALINPYTLASIIHQLLATIVTGIFWIVGVLAYKALKHYEKREYYFKMFKITALIGSILFILQGIEGHEQGLMVYLYQPTKFAMITGLEKSNIYPPAGLTIFGNPNYIFNGFDYFIEVAKNHPNPDLKIAGIPLRDIALTDTLEALKKLPIVSLMYELKIGIAALGLILSLLMISTIIFKKFWNGKEKYLLISGILMFFIPSAISGLGWAVREIGRKPWTVYGLLYPKELITPNPITFEVTFTIIGGIIIGFIMNLLTIYVVLNKPPKFLKMDDE